MILTTEELVQVNILGLIADVESEKELNIVLEARKLLLLLAHDHGWLSLEHFELIPVNCVTKLLDSFKNVIL